MNKHLKNRNQTLGNTPVRRRIFRAMDFFMVRAAASPWNTFHALRHDPRFIEAVALASPSLFKRLRDNCEGDICTKTDGALNRYARRMATRPTPFGLFAGVGIGRFGDDVNVSLGSAKNWQRHARPDMEFLLGLIRTLEKDDTLPPSVRVYPNQLILSEGKRLVLSNPTSWEHSVRKGRKDRPFNVSIRATPPVLVALELARSGTSISELVAQMAMVLAEGDKARIEKLVRTLLAREFLFSELRPPASTGSPLDHILQIIAKWTAHRELYSSLQELALLIEEYQKTPLGEGVSCLERIGSAMRPYARSENHLHVDLSIKDADVVLPARVAAECGRAADAIWRLSSDEARLLHLRQYHSEFMTRFGMDRELPLTYVLHEEFGIGPPRTYREPPATRFRDANMPADKPMSPLAELCYAAVAKGEREVEITEDLVDTLAPADSSQYPPSFELYAEVLSDSRAHLSRGEFQLVLSPIIGADSAGKTFGRFLYFLPPSATDSLRAAQQKRAEAERDVIFAELKHFPASSRLANVVLSPCLHEYELSVATSRSPGSAKQVSIDDLLIGATRERLYLRAKDGREVVVSANHMLNYDLLPNAVRLILEISLARSRPFALLDMGALQRVVFFPRIKYRRTVLCPATWNIRRSDVSMSDSDWPTSFRVWRAQWSVPRYVFIGTSDQRLLLDLDVAIYVDVLRERLQKEEIVTLMEMIGTLDQRFFSSEEGQHFAECAFPMACRVAGSPPALPPMRFGKCVDEGKRLRSYGSEWLFLKIYCNPDRLDRLLCEHVIPFADECVATGIAAKWFYIFYRDPDSHIRLRFYVPNKIGHQLLERIGDWSAGLMLDGQVRDFAIAPYEREIERYGGIDLIPFSEAFFCADSAFCGALVSAHIADKFRLVRVQLMAIGAADIALRVGDIRPNNLFPSSKLEDRDLFNDDFKRVCTGIWGLDDERMEVASQLKSLLERRAESLEVYLSAIRDAIPLEQREYECTAIVTSLIHMQCNRFNGDEPVAQALAKRIVQWVCAMESGPWLR